MILDYVAYACMYIDNLLTSFYMMIPIAWNRLIK